MINLADLHADTMYECFKHRDFLDKEERMITQTLISKFGSYMQVFAHFIPEDIVDKYTFFEQMYAHTLNVLSAADIAFCDTASAAKQALAEGQKVAFLSVENGDFFAKEQDIAARVKEIRQKGIRFFSLVYNHGNALGGGAAQTEKYTLTFLGKTVVEALCNEKITIDISHANAATAEAILDAAGKVPVVATHSNCYALCPHARNISDKLIRAVADRGGLIGLNLYPPFLRQKKGATIEDIAFHMRHMLRVAGEDSVAFGADLDGVDALPQGIKDVGSFPFLYDFLKPYGFSDRILEKVFFQNVYNFVNNNF